MPYEPVRRFGARPWTTVLGLCLASVAAGSFIAFSLVARDATNQMPDAPVAAIAPATSAPAINFANDAEHRDDKDGMRPSDGGRDLVSGSRLADGATSTGTGVSKKTGDAAGRRDGGMRDSTTDGTSTKAPSSRTDDPPVYAKKTDNTSKGGIGGKGKPASGKPSPNGKAKGHSKSKGKGHDKHPGDH